MLKKKKKKKKRERKQTNKNKQSCKNYKESIGTKLITNTKKHKLKILSRVWYYPISQGFLKLRKNPPSFNDTTTKSLQSCPTLCDPIDGSPSGSPVPGIIQARTLEWVAISFSNAWKWKVKAKSLSRIWLLATPWTAAHQAPPSMGFSRQEYWSGVPLPSPQWSITQPLKIIHLNQF